MYETYMGATVEFTADRGWDTVAGVKKIPSAAFVTEFVFVT